MNMRPKGTSFQTNMENQIGKIICSDKNNDARYKIMWIYNKSACSA